MAKTLQLRRGTTAENDDFTGAQGEVTVDTEKNTLRVHDGSTVGGTELVTDFVMRQLVAKYLPLTGGELSGGISLKGRPFLTATQADDTGSVQFAAGSGVYAADGHGAMLYLFGSRWASSWGVPGSFALYANDSTGKTVDLAGFPNGDLFWGGQHIARIVSWGGSSIRFSNGYQICWGYSNNGWGAYEQYFTGPTYPQALWANTSTCCSVNVTANYNTGFSYQGVYANGNKSTTTGIRFIAIGPWM